jgi:hypothetical protein
MSISGDPNDRRSLRKGLAQRVRTLVREQFGENGHWHLASMLGVPSQTLLNYEAGCTIPAEIILAIGC